MKVYVEIWHSDDGGVHISKVSTRKIKENSDFTTVQEIELDGFP